MARVLEQVGVREGGGGEQVPEQVGEGGGRGFSGFMWEGGPFRPTVFPKSGIYPEPYTPHLHVVQGKAAEAAAVALQLQAEEAARLADAELALAGEWRGEEGKITLVEGAGG